MGAMIEWEGVPAVRGIRALPRILACCAVLVAYAPPAHAGVYDVWGCALADGSPVPANGWTAGGSSSARFEDSCQVRGGGLVANLDNNSFVAPDRNQPGLAMSSWTFSAPPALTIANYTLYRYARSSEAGQSSRDFQLVHVRPGGALETVEACVYPAGCTELGDATVPFAPSNRFERDGLQLSQLRVSAICSSPSGCPATAPPSYLEVFSSRVGLSDDRAPAFRSAPTGSLLETGAPIDGVRSVEYAAYDDGGGLARAALVVDGVMRKEQPADPADASCREPYVETVPCSLVAEGTIRFDTAVLSDGPHQVALAVIDAGGNRALSSPVEVVTNNRGGVNGTGASRRARIMSWFLVGGRSRTSRTVPFGRRATVYGSLTTVDGVPIRGAGIDVSATPSVRGAAARPLGRVTSDRRGRFTFTAPKGASRRFRLSYRPFESDPTPAAAAEVTLNVRAGMALRVTPRRTTSRGRISFTGRLLGGPYRAGTQVQLFAVARKGRDRVPVATLRADRRGRFQFRYRFRRTFAPFTYYFQAVVQRQNGYPYATGRSKRVSVRIVR
jgi:hypothetical protein